MRLLTYALMIALGCAPLVAKDEKGKFTERLDDSASLLSEIMATSDRAIPQNLLDKSACIVIVPGLKKGAFVFGAKYGRGFAFAEPTKPGRVGARLRRWPLRAEAPACRWDFPPRTSCF